MSGDAPRGAFHGDPAVRQALLATIDRHLAAGTLIFDGDCWDGTRGSPMGVAIEGDDPADYAQRYGYPLPLAALLDLLISGIPGDAVAAGAARDWVAVVDPGADLSQVPAQLVLSMLAAPEARGIDDDLAGRLIALHQRALTPTPPTRAEWTAIRHAVLERDVTNAGPVIRAVQDLWEACTWPADRGQSTLALAFAKWRNLRVQAAGGDWSEADMQRTNAILERLWNEHQAAREADEIVDYHALLTAADPDLADRHLRYLDRTNGRFLASSTEMAEQCISLFSFAPQVARCPA